MASDYSRPFPEGDKRLVQTKEEKLAQKKELEKGGK